MDVWGNKPLFALSNIGNVVGSRVRGAQIAPNLTAAAHLFLSNRISP